MQRHAFERILVLVFAPWCPTCSSRVLLGPRRIESLEPGPSGYRAVLRCHCGALLVWSPAEDGSPPAEAPGSTAAPVPTGSEPRDERRGGYQPAAASASR